MQSIEKRGSKIGQSRSFLAMIYNHSLTLVYFLSAAISIPDEKLGEAVAVVAVPKLGENPSVDEVMKAASEVLPKMSRSWKGMYLLYLSEDAHYLYHSLAHHELSSMLDLRTCGYEKSLWRETQTERS